MSKSFFTIGMAGHIDHGKTSLTKALTGIDTDRLKEEKERNISIEPGYAPLPLGDESHVSIVDVPGHERFIRQMIAGVAGIDLVLLIVAGDEGVMPQTVEHLQILQFLGISRCMVVVTKTDRIESELKELVKDEIIELLAETAYKDAPIHFVDSLSGNGISELKTAIEKEIKKLGKPDSTTGSFRLPIDQAFTVQGHGTVVRGTIFEGAVSKNTELILLPKGKRVKVRQIQVHHQDTTEAYTGQRAAINISGASKNEIRRGDVLVDSDNYHVTNTIDVTLQFVDSLSFPLKQRAPVKVHIGTAETVGKIVFFDRNEVKDEKNEVLCQIRLDNEIVARRGDRFILRRPTPVETLGGGWVIQPLAGKYRFGEETITKLKKQKESTPEETIRDLIGSQKLLSIQHISKLTSFDRTDIQSIIEAGILSGDYLEIPGHGYTTITNITTLKKDIFTQLQFYHNDYPMRLGISKAELIQVIAQTYPKELVDFSINHLLAQGEIHKEEQYLFKKDFQPTLPANMKKAMEEVIKKIREDKLTPKKWDEYLIGTPISSSDANELKTYLIKTGRAYQLTDDTLLDHNALNVAIQHLQIQTNDSFSLADAKDILNLSRKYLIPLLELLDELGITIRQDGSRVWKGKNQEVIV